MFDSLLVVDDDEDFRFVLKESIKCERLTNLYIEKVNGLSALQWLQSRDSLDVFPNKGKNLILLDLNMPIMNGFEFLLEFNRLQERNSIFYPQTRIAIISTSENEEDVTRLMAQKNVIDYLIKIPTLEQIKGLFAKHPAFYSP